jgi:ubiquinone/menaquinone biosynthesis C-methylase UbiE
MTKDFIDNFSFKSKEYSYSRPVYPNDLFEYLSKITPMNDLAWDCATGNGQAAIGLGNYFKNVIASDASKNQIDNKFERKNILYKVFPAEAPILHDDSVDLVTVATAVHWFDFDSFYREVNRVSRKKPQEGRIAVWCYGMHKISPKIDEIIQRLDVDGDILGDFWPKEIRFIKEGYRTIPFPFREIEAPGFNMVAYWNMEQLFNYMHTWSAVKRYLEEKKSDPLDLVREEIKNFWGAKESEQKLVKWDIFLRVGITQQ